jgi:hypothetical protein
MSAAASTPTESSASAPTEGLPNGGGGASGDGVAAVTDQLASTAVSAESKKGEAETDEEDAAEAAPVSAISGLHPEDVDAKVTVGGSDIYKAAKSFDELGLRKEILNAVYDMKFTNPSKIQAAALPVVLDSSRPNLIGQAHHGSGNWLLHGMNASLTERHRIIRFICGAALIY